MGLLTGIDTGGHRGDNCLGHCLAPTHAREKLEGMGAPQ